MMMRNIDDDDDDEVKKEGDKKREEHMIKEKQEFNDSNISLLHEQHQMGSGQHASVHDHMELLHHITHNQI
eukprot:6889133-Ditylum_brightwellii.AAC.1